MIRASNLSKFYGGKRALGPVSFEINPGETVGFLGLNGAGKTTALRILACDLRPSGGTVEVGGVDAVADPQGCARGVGLVRRLSRGAAGHRSDAALVAEPLCAA